MGRLSSPEQVRARAAECRARADHPVLRPDAAAWLDLADTWDRLAEAMEASAHEERVDNNPTRAAEESTKLGGREPLPPDLFLVEGSAMAKGDPRKGKPDPKKPVREGKAGDKNHPGSTNPKRRK